MRFEQFQQLSNIDFWKSLKEDKDLLQSFSRTIFETVRETAHYLPTSRESEALPFLEVLGDSLTEMLKDRKYLMIYQIIEKNENLVDLLFSDLFQGTVEAVFRGKLYHEKKIVQMADIIFIKLVELCSSLISKVVSAENQPILSLLSTILNRHKEFYKNVGKDSISTHPFGEPIFPSNQRKLWIEETLEEGMKIDCVRISNGKKLWVKGVFLGGSSSSFCKVRYESDAQEGFLNNRYLEVAPLGVYTTDESWRDNLQVGDYIDLFIMSNKWVVAQIEKVEKEEIFISQDSFSSQLWQKKEDMTEEENQNGYWGSINPFFPTVAKAGSFTERTSLIDDSNDRFYCSYQKNKSAIMRYITSSSKTSTLLIKYINIFNENNGLQNIMDFFKKDGLNQNILMYYTKILKSITDFIVEDLVREIGPVLLKSLVSFALQCTEKNLRETTQEQLQDLLDTIENLALRIMSNQRCYQILNYILLKVFFICLNSEILDKQSFAIKIFSKIVRSIEINSEENKFEDHFGDNNEENEDQTYLLEKNKYENENDLILKNIVLEKELIEICDLKFENFDEEKGFTENFIAKILDKNDVFSKIIKSHESLVQKSTKIIKLLFKTELIDGEQIKGLWDLMKKAELDLRTYLLSLLKESTWQMNNTTIMLILQIIKEEIEEDPIECDILELIIDLRRSSYSKTESTEIHDMVNQILWMTMNNSQTKKEVFKKSLQYLIRFTISNNNYETAQSLFEKAVQNLLEKKNYLTNLKIISKILKEIKYEEGFLNYLSEKQFSEFLISQVLAIKNTLDNSGTFELDPIKISKKEKEYYMILKKSLKFVWKISIQKDFKDLDIQKLFFNVWIHFMNSGQNTESENIEFNNYIQSYLKNIRKDLEEDQIEKFLLSIMNQLENIKTRKLFDRFKELFFILNLKKGKVDKKEVKIESNFYNDYKKQKIEFYVLNSPSENLILFPEIESVFYKTTNKKFVENLCEFFRDLLTKPDYASAAFDQIYINEENKLIQKLQNVYSSENFDKVIEKNGKENELNESLMKRLKLIMLIQTCLGKSEKRGFGHLVSLASLQEGNSLILTFEKESKYQTRSSTKIFFKEKAKLSSEYSTQVENIGLKNFKSDEDFSSNKNNQTLHQLGVKSGDVFDFFVIDSPEIEEEPLVDE